MRCSVQDTIDSAAKATRAALRTAGLPKNSVIGIGVDFTSCTMLPALRDGTPLCLVESSGQMPLASAQGFGSAIAARRKPIASMPSRASATSLSSPGTSGRRTRMVFAKMLETLEHAPRVFDAAEVWLEAGDWSVWRLVGGAAATLPRSTCQAGYKGM